jgi:hypothetical protein
VVGPLAVVDHAGAAVRAQNPDPYFFHKKPFLSYSRLRLSGSKRRDVSVCLYYTTGIDLSAADKFHIFVSNGYNYVDFMGVLCYTVDSIPQEVCRV